MTVKLRDILNEGKFLDFFKLKKKSSDIVDNEIKFEVIESLPNIRVTNLYRRIFNTKDIKQLINVCENNKTLMALLINKGKNNEGCILFSPITKNHLIVNGWLFERGSNLQQELLQFLDNNKIDIEIIPSEKGSSTDETFFKKIGFKKSRNENYLIRLAKKK